MKTIVMKIVLFKVIALAMIVLAFSVRSASATNIDMSGSCTWSISGSTIDMSVGKIQNMSTGGTSGTLKIQVWATTSPYTGGSINGWILGTRTLGQLQGGYSYNNISGSVAYTAPPDGTYYTTLIVAEYTGGSYLVGDHITFPGTTIFGDGGGGGDGSITIDGTGSWSINGSTINIGAAKVSNNRSGGTSGTLRLQLWATTYPYASGAINGYILGTRSLGQLQGGYSFDNISGYVSYTAPPNGTYYTSLILSEYDGAGYSIVDYLTFSGTSTFGESGGKSDLTLGGTSTYRKSGSSLVIMVPKIANSGKGASGKLRLRLWAMKTRYTGAKAIGFPSTVKNLAPLASGYSYSNIKGTAPWKNLRRGSYYMTLIIEEYSGGRYIPRDYFNFKSKLTVR